MTDKTVRNHPESTGFTLFSDSEIMTNLTQDDEAVLKGGGYSNPGHGKGYGHYGGKGYGGRGYGGKKYS